MAKRKRDEEEMSARERRRADEASVMEYLKNRSQEVDDGDRMRRNRNAAATAGREVLFMEQLREALRDTFSEVLAKPTRLPAKPRGRAARILNVMISDTHYGSNLDPREVGHNYGPVEEARRTAAICRQVAEYKRQYRDETELFVHLLGDLIQGQLHDFRDGAPLAEQVAAAMRILVQALRFLAAEFPRGVTVWCTPGNHGRNTARHRDRAVLQKWDSIETMVYTALKEMSAFIPNVKVVIGYEPKYDFNLFETVGLGTHGDTVINPGYPGKTIDVKGVKQQISDINNARVMKGEKPYSLVIMGHVHVGSMVHLPGGVIMLTNGALIPPDAYAKSIGIFETACGQWMWESVEGHPVGDARFIEVNSDTDQDETLDQIVKPFKGL